MFIIQNTKTKKFIKDVTALDSHSAKALCDNSIKIEYTTERKEAVSYPLWNAAWEFLRDLGRMKSFEIIGK